MRPWPPTCGTDKVRLKAANIANAWKKWQGESLGLERLGTLGKKRAYEERFARWAAGQPEYAGVLERLRSAYEAGNGASYAADFYTEGIFSIELMSLANYVTVALEAGEMPVVPGLFYKDYEPEIDRPGGLCPRSGIRGACPRRLHARRFCRRACPKPVAWKSMSVGCSTVPHWRTVHGWRH